MFRNVQAILNFLPLLLLWPPAALAQPTNNVWTRTLMVQSHFGRGTIFSIDVDQREYWITAKHILTGAKHPPYGTIKGNSEELKILNPGADGEEWLSIKFLVLDPGKDIDIVVLAPPKPLLEKPLPSVKTSAEGVMYGGDCEFVGYPYGGGFRGNFANGRSAWMPFVKHCGISALATQKEGKVWILDGINNAGFSGGPVIYHTGAEQQIFAVVSGYETEPAEVITSPLQKLSPSAASPDRPSRRTGDLKNRTKQTVNVNAGFIVAFDIGYALEVIHKNPVGPIRTEK